MAKKRSHLAGVIPVANFDDALGTRFASGLLPLDKDFTMIQKSVYECAIAGCNTIWIVANDDMAPIIKHHIGEWVYDPVYLNRARTAIGSDMAKRHIPIYYVPILPKDRDRRDSYGWSVLFGMHSAWYVSYRISKWVVPQKYYVSFPHSIHDIYQLRADRLAISHTRKNYFLTHEGKTIKDGLPISFSMRGKDFINCRRRINELTTRTYEPPKEGETYEDMAMLPFEERWSARWFDLETIFEKVSEEDAAYNEVEWYHDLTTWEGYRTYLGSRNAIVRPEDHLTKPHQLNRLCVDEEGEE